MKHLLHLNKLWTRCHFMSIQTTYVACIWRCLLWFLTWLCCLCGCQCGLFFLVFACLHIVIRHPTICAIFVNLPSIILCFASATCLVHYGIESALLASVIVMLYSHNIVASLWCCSVDCFIPVVTMLKYACKPTLNTIVKNLHVVGTCKLWPSFWICS